MKLDNFTTARCRKCGWIKQFQPGREYNSKEFMCNCQEVEEGSKKSKLELLKEEAKILGIKYPHNISEIKLSKKIKELKHGNES